VRSLTSDDIHGADETQDNVQMAAVMNQRQFAVQRRITTFYTRDLYFEPRIEYAIWEYRATISACFIVYVAFVIVSSSPYKWNI